MAAIEQHILYLLMIIVFMAAIGPWGLPAAILLNEGLQQLQRENRLNKGQPHAAVMFTMVTLFFGMLAYLLDRLT